MTKMSPEQEALYALECNVARGDLPAAAQLEYDRLKPAWEHEKARLAQEREHPPGDRGRQGSWLVTRPSRYAWPVTGDQVRDTTFLSDGNRFTGDGYDVAEVDDLLRRVAAELDAGRSPEPLIRNAAFRKVPLPAYNIGAVDWFLGRLLLHPGAAELARMRADPWRGLGVVPQFSRSGAGFLTGRSAPQVRQDLRNYHAEECSKAWQDFGQQPGLYLRLEDAGVRRRELRTADLRPMASVSVSAGLWPAGSVRPMTISASGSNFVLQKASTARSSFLDIDEIGARRSRDLSGHFAATARGIQAWDDLKLRELVSESGIPRLYTCGIWFTRAYNTHNYDLVYPDILFSDQRWLRFLERGTEIANKILTAVDEAGDSVARYRLIPPPTSTLRRAIAYFLRHRDIVEITVHPGWELTDELVLAIAISAHWFSCRNTPSGGGGG